MNTAWYLSNTQSFDESPFLTATISQGRATQSLPQGCAAPNQTPGYNYDNPGVNVYSISLQGSILVYEQDTKLTSPCGGNSIGLVRTVKELQRMDAPTAKK